jgi:hypothetical protein
MTSYICTLEEIRNKIRFLDNFFEMVRPKGGPHHKYIRSGYRLRNPEQSKSNLVAVPVFHKL